MEKTFYVYILASRRNGTLYVGVTSDLLKRVWEHKNIVAEGFTEKYGVDKLVYYERFYDPGYAIRREKRLKKYNREWKKDLIESSNPEWKDLFEKLTGGSGSNDPVGR
ncbi:MAG: GIY-YIG nuclease family protein [Nitrospirota bacterium]|nr:GIY-YIG nuclease family protein [Nitrospirota bacterium]